MILDFLLRNSTDDRTRIGTPDELYKYLTRRMKSASGVSVTTDSSMRFAAVATCVKILAESVGQLPLNLYRQDGKNKQLATDHPLYSLLKVAPNEYQTAQEWKELLIACLALHGNAYCYVLRVGGRVLELWPLLPGTVTPVRDPTTRVVTYKVRVSKGSEIVYPAEEILHLKLFGLDGLCGMSPLEQARESIGMGIAAERHGGALFANGATPGGFLSMPAGQTLSEDSAKRLKESWDERHAGAENAYKTAVLEGGMTWESMAIPSKDAQWLESRKFSRSEIHGLFRVPPHLAADLERATFSNIEHSSLDFIIHSLMPYCTRIEGRIHLQLLTPAERKQYFVKFVVAALLRGDMTARANFYTSMMQNGAFSPNEIRELEDLNPREGGDIYLVPANMNPSTAAGVKPAKADPAPAPTPDPAPDDVPAE